MYTSVNLAIIGSDNGSSPDRRQSTIWTNADLLSTGPSGTTFSEIRIETEQLFFKKIYFKMSSGLASMCQNTSSMKTSSNENIFRITGPLWGESTGHRWITLTKASDAVLWCYLWCLPEQTVEQTIETPEIWDAMMSIWRHCNGLYGMNLVHEVSKRFDISRRATSNIHCVIIFSLFYSPSGSGWTGPRLNIKVVFLDMGFLS